MSYNRSKHAHPDKRNDGRGKDKGSLIARASRGIDRLLDRRPTKPLSMAQKLRIKFVLLGTSAILVVLTTILGIAEMTIYSELIETADHTLSLLADSNGTFPEDSRTYGLYDDQITRETPYESRWFIVKVAPGADGQSTVSVDTSKTVTINEEAAKRYSEIAAQDGHAFGFVNMFRYIHRTNEDGDLFVFLDRGRHLQSFYRSVMSTISIAVIGVTTVIVILIIASKPLMSPVVESHIKQKQFITNAGHDIKTPLTIIAADADVLEMEIGEENEWVSDIRLQVEELTKLTNDLIFLSKMEEDRSDDEKILFNLSDTVTRTADSFAMVAKSSGKELDLDIEQDVRVMGNEKMLRQLTSVLVDNAIKYSVDGGTVRVVLSKRKRNVSLLVTNVTDAPDELQVNRWFDRFYQEDSSRSHGRGGFGIGLSIAQAVVTAHAGHIQASVKNDTVEILVSMPIGA